jgi:hypothetical protein
MSLATNGGFITSNGKMSEVHICCPQYNDDNSMVENMFVTYWIDTRLLPELYKDMYIQREEISLYENDIEEQERIAKEREESILAYKKLKSRKKKVKMILDEGDDIEENDIK